MYNDSDIDAAVSAGTLTSSNALALRRFVAQRHAEPPPPETDGHFRYWAGAGGILPALALLPLFIGLTMLSAGVFGRLGGLPVLIFAWWLSGRFATRREGVPMTVLFLAFVVNMAVTLTAMQGVVDRVSPAQGLIIAGGCAITCFAFWKRFRLPIAYAAGVMATLTLGDHMLMGLLPHPPAWLVSSWMLMVAIATFGVAMWWDMTDVYRQTIRSDIAFWLHGLAGFELAAWSARAILGVRSSGEGWQSLGSRLLTDIAPHAALLGLAVFTLFVIVALAIDRRAVVVVGMIFVFGALNAMMGPAMLPFALLLTGIACTVLVLNWRRLRRTVLNRLPPKIRAQLPRSDPTFLWERPID